MDYKLLGRTGVKVSELCLGTMTFGWKLEEKPSHEIMDRFVDEGGNFLDTANVYNNGVSEKIIGNWMKGRDREDLVIATKVRFRMGDGVNSVGLSRKHIIKSVNDSLERLRTDYIDLLQLHAWDPLTPIGETLSALNDLVREGKVRYIGASNFRAWQLASAMEYSRSHGLEEFVSLQPQYSMLVRATEYELLPYCRMENMAVLPWSPLKGGLLSGKYTKDMKEPPEGTRLKAWRERGMQWPWNSDGEYVWRTLDKLNEIGKRLKKKPSQVALNWLLMNDAVTSPIIGATSMGQLEENLGATGWKLSGKDMKELDEASRLYVSYPYDEGASDQQSRS